MVTIKDIAKVAGVSHGTVSNVLNKRGNVTASKIKLVEEAAKRLGYQLNTQAQQLRKGMSEKYVVVLFEVARERYKQVIDEWQSLLDDVDIIYIKKRSDIPCLLQNMASQMPTLLLCLGFSPAGYGSLTIPYCEVDVYADTKQGIAFDIEAIEEQLSDMINLSCQLHMCFLSSVLQKETGLLYQLSQRLSATSDLVQYYSVKNKWRLIKLYPKLKDLRATDWIVVDDEQLLNALDDVYEWFNQQEKPQVCFIGGRNWLKNQCRQYIELDYRLLAQASLTKYCHEHHIVVPVKRQKADKEVCEMHNPAILTLLIIKSPMSQVLRILADRYAHLTGTRIHILENTYDELLTMIESDTIPSDVDIIRIDMAWLETFGEKIFQPVPLQPLTGAINQKIASALPREYTHIGSKQYAFPLDVSSQVLVYRKDIFDNPLIQRQYYEQYKQKLQIPETFEAFDALSPFFTRAFNPSSPTLYAHSIALKTSIQAACDFMPRFREALLKAGMDMQALQQALQQYKKSFQYTEGHFTQWWEEFVLSLESGKTVMEVVFTNYVSPLISSLNNDTTFEFGIAHVPGNQMVIGGGSIGIYHQSEQMGSCLAFINWLYSEDISTLITALGGFIPSTFVVQSNDLKQQFSWLSHFDETFKMGSRTKWYQFDTDFYYECLLGNEIIQEFQKNDEKTV